MGLRTRDSKLKEQLSQTEVVITHKAAKWATWGRLQPFLWPPKTTIFHRKSYHRQPFSSHQNQVFFKATFQAVFVATKTSYFHQKLYPLQPFLWQQNMVFG